MGKVTDNLGRDIDYFPLDLTLGETSTVIVINVEPEAGAVLRSTADEDVVVLGRPHAVGSFVDLASGIDLTLYTPGVPVPFDIKVTVPTLADTIRRVSMWVGVTKSGAAGWVT
jgi:hypothetical protein